jgi:hypothetical protein
MSEQASFTLRSRNPDVLTCIANLSNDEVFTPPEFANRMLDTLTAAWATNNKGANLWADPKVTFLDPFTKSGVFLRNYFTADGGIEGHDSRLAEAGRSYPDKAGLRHRHHALDQFAGPTQLVLQ